MKTFPNRIFLDTNIYIIGVADSLSSEWEILLWAGFDKKRTNSVKVVVSEELFDQILRVSKRLKNKDWGSQIVANMWQNFNVHNVSLEAEELARVEALGIIPREDVGIYLTASKGKSQCFISANHKLIRSLAQETGEFECLTPQDFVKKYLHD
ncbi:hypothetical protein V2H45_11825 [Tumidithrix elongata RA019]|uniref:PIN domain-containing protein n=1 Tax=Tumidithrix elongata BACA0141 TaxID=2716417 RepID=A0AAW9Q493_9CYAN|nr:hypothetical protein [Tumidithrix elongata RA019]